jgi:hypothetical protein
MMRRVLSAALISVLLVGCQSVKWPWSKDSSMPVASTDTTGTATDAPLVPEPGLATSPEQRFSDLPLPMGVKQDADRSFVYESNTLQIGRMVYTCKSSVNEISQFFIRECPSANWKLQNVTEAGGTQLIFTKPDRRLTVVVQNLGVARGRQITLLLVPDSQ